MGFPMCSSRTSQQNPSELRSLRISRNWGGLPRRLQRFFRFMNHLEWFICRKNIIYIIYIYIHKYVYIYICIYINVYISIYIYIHTYRHHIIYIRITWNQYDDLCISAIEWLQSRMGHCSALDPTTQHMQNHQQTKGHQSQFPARPRRTPVCVVCAGAKSILDLPRQFQGL